MIKKLLSLFVSLLMVLSLLPAAAFAKTETSTYVPSSVNAQAKIGDALNRSSSEPEPTELPQTEAPDEPTENPENLIAGYYFETEDEAAEWSFVDADGDGYTWRWFCYNVNYLFDSAYEGNGFIASDSYNATWGGALTPDNWAISPEFMLPEQEASISMYIGAQDPDWSGEHYAVYVGTSSDPESMTMISDELVSPSSYARYEYDLSDYAGQSVYVAIRHFNCTDQFRLNLDQFEIWNKKVSEQELIPITEIRFEGYESPVAGENSQDHLDFDDPEALHYSFATEGFDAPCWWNNDADILFSDIFVEGTSYSAGLTFIADDGYYFVPDCAVYINGGEVEADPEYTGIDTDDNTRFYVWTMPEIATSGVNEFAIHEVYVDGYESPIAGEDSQEHLNITVPTGANYHIYQTSWSPEWWDNDVDDEFFGTFVEGTRYSVGMTVQAETGYYFADDCVFYVNGTQELVDGEYTGVENEDNTYCYVWTIPEIATAGEEPPVTPEPVPVYTLDEALNIEGGSIHFESDGDYPWIAVNEDERGRLYAMSGNAGVSSSDSIVTATITANEGDVVTFEFQAWGEGTNTYLDYCEFSVDGVRQGYWGAYQNDEWEVFTSEPMSEGEHVLTWTYHKDGSVNNIADCFMVDNVAISEGELPPSGILGDIDMDGDVDTADALLALRYVMGIIDLTEDQLAQAEVSGDENVTITDSLLILRKAMEIIDNFPIEVL